MFLIVYILHTGFGIYYVEDNQVKTTNFNIISENLSQNAESVIRAFRILRSQTFFRSIDQKDYIIWADCGKHFRNKLLIGYLFKELQREKINGNLSYIFLN